MTAGLLAFGAVLARSRGPRGKSRVPEVSYRVPKEQWTMPPLALLARPPASTARKWAILTMEGYLLLAVVLLVVKGVQLAGG